jgi:hypothetical protein
MTNDPEFWLLKVAAALLVGLLFFSCVRDSQAAITNEAPSSFVQADALLREASMVAAVRWRHRGFQACLPTINVYDEDEPGVAARGALGCTIWFDRAFRDRIWTTYNDRRQPFYGRAAALTLLCVAAIHETGHTLGMDHYPGTVMDAVFNVQRPSRECKRWVKYKMTDTALGRHYVRIILKNKP